MLKGRTMESCFPLELVLEDIKEKETRANGEKLYNFYCKTDRFKHSTLVHAIDKYNFKLMN